jgi:hypothetical protein
MRELQDCQQETSLLSVKKVRYSNGTSPMKKGMSECPLDGDIDVVDLVRLVLRTRFCHQLESTILLHPWQLLIISELFVLSPGRGQVCRVAEL